MRSINKVILIGNLTRDPELRQTPNGQNVVTFGLATNREWVTRDGRKQSLTEYHDLVAWANLAEICAKYLKKSKLVYVEGYLKTRSWDTPEGIRKFKTEIVVQDMIMLDKRTSDDGGEYIPQEEPVNASGEHNHRAPRERSAAPAANVSENAAPATVTPPAVETTQEQPTSTGDTPLKTPPAMVDIDQDLGL
jgi:single-strand DNA-binding protein